MLNSRSQILLSADLAVMGWTVSRHKKAGSWSRMESDGIGWIWLELIGANLDIYIHYSNNSCQVHAKTSRLIKYFFDFFWKFFL